MIVSKKEAVQFLKKGKPVAIPTETVYGLAAGAFNQNAITEIYCIKGRPSDNPLIAHIADLEQLSVLTDRIPQEAQKLIQTFWPGPLTILFHKKDTVPDKITAGLPNVAIRMPNHPIALSIIKETGPLVAPSANKSGSPSPTRVEHVLSDYNGLIPVVDGGKCDIGIESTVISLIDNQALILRPGKISKQELEQCIGKTFQVIGNNPTPEKVASPGMKYTHYSPKAKVRWLNQSEKNGEYAPDTMYLLIKSNKNTEQHHSYQNDFKKFTQDLFDQFRKADELHFHQIAIEPFDETDDPLAPALLNRIMKAIGK